MCHKPNPLDLQQVRDVVALIDRVRRVGAEPGVGLHPDAVARAAHAILQNPLGQVDTPSIREKLFELRQSPENEVLFQAPTASAKKTWVHGKRELSMEELSKLDPRQRLSVINGEKGARL